MISAVRAVGDKTLGSGFALIDAGFSDVFKGKTMFEAVGSDPSMKAVMEMHRADDMLRREECTEVQGYLLSRPVPSFEALRLLSSDRARIPA